jgi:hypothetical protein
MPQKYQAEAIQMPLRRGLLTAGRVEARESAERLQAPERLCGR